MWPREQTGRHHPKCSRRGVVIDLDVAELIMKVFLPTNERRMRKADPSVVAAVTAFKDAVSNARTGAKP
jgi:hypothetical protein